MPNRADVKLFVYGELCKPAVLVEVIGRVPLAELAILFGYRRRLDHRTGYYRATPQPDARIAGLLLDGIDAREIEILDDYENVAGGEYERREVKVHIPAAATRLSAQVYAGGEVPRTLSPPRP